MSPDSKPADSSFEKENVRTSDGKRPQIKGSLLPSLDYKPTRSPSIETANTGNSSYANAGARPKMKAASTSALPSSTSPIRNIFMQRQHASSGSDMITSISSETKPKIEDGRFVSGVEDTDEEEVFTSELERDRTEFGSCARSNVTVGMQTEPMAELQKPPAEKGQYERSATIMLKLYDEDLKKSIQHSSSKNQPSRWLFCSKIVWEILFHKILKKDCNRFNTIKGKFGETLFNAASQVDSEYLKRFFPKRKYVLKSAGEFAGKGEHIHALIAYYAIFLTDNMENSASDVSFNHFWETFESIGSVVKFLVEKESTRQIAAHHVMPLMAEMVETQCNVHLFFTRLEQDVQHLTDENIFIPAIATFFAKARLQEKEGGDMRVTFSCAKELSLIVGRLAEIKSLKKVIPLAMPFFREITQMLTSRCDSITLSFIKDAKSAAQKYFSALKFFPGGIIYYVTARLYSIYINSYNDVVNVRDEIEECVYHMREVVENMTREQHLKKVALEYMIPLMHEIKTISRSRRESQGKLAIVNEAWHLYHIGLCYFYCNEHTYSTNMNEAAVKLMEDELKDTAKAYQVYGHCLHNIGSAYELRKDMKKAQTYYQLAFKALSSAEDFDNEEEKQEQVAGELAQLQIIEL